jgi:3-phenylpropionate/trans-cinnamate dioxygenase ferredoxin subunit
VECPRHGSEFDLRTGAALTLPATRPAPVYRTEVAGGEVFVHTEEGQ